MLELSLITEEEYSEAINFKIEFSNGSNQIPKNNPAIKQYLEVAFTETIKIVKKKYSCNAEKAIDKILNGDTDIYLNIDTKLQNKAYEIATTNYTEYPKFELGAVMSSKSGEVLSIISSRTGSEIDHAYAMTRQTGSSIKPLSVYAPAYDLGLLKPTNYLYDTPVSITSATGRWQVKNADRRFRGQVTVNDAIAYSLNTTAVIALERVTLSKSLEYVKSFGITTIDKNDLYYPALGLGGLTYGVSPFEMTQAYNVFNNDGVFKSISTIKKINIYGETLSKHPNEHQVISKEACDMIKTSMNCGARYGTGKTANIDYTTAYIKTGTTNGSKDIWTCGLTDEITLCIWGGYDIPETVPFYNVNPIWKQLVDAYYNK